MTTSASRALRDVEILHHARRRTGLEREMETVLLHNAIDLVTLFDLALRLAA